MSLKIKNLKYCLTVSKKANLELENFSIFIEKLAKSLFFLIFTFTNRIIDFWVNLCIFCYFLFFEYKNILMIIWYISMGYTGAYEKQYKINASNDKCHKVCVQM